MDDSGVLFFLHLPKAGGSTIHSIIDRAYFPGEVYTLKPKGVHPLGNTPQRYLEGVLDQWDTINDDELKDIRIVKGHFAFGIHSKLNLKSTYFTFMRDPVDRVISHYSFIKYRPNNAHSSLANKISLKEFVEKDYEINNLQTKMLYGRGYQNVHDSGELLEGAINNINDYFPIIGLIEEFDKSLVLLNKAIGLRISPYKKQNVSRITSSQQRIDQATRKVILEKNKLDIELYQIAKQRFDSFWTKSQPYARYSLAKFRIKNAVINKFQRFEYREGF